MITASYANTKDKQKILDYDQYLPTEWKLKRARWLLEPIDERSSDGSEDLLSVSEHRGVVKRNDITVTMFMAESYEGYKLCNKGDLVINSLWAWSRGLGFSNYHGIVSTAYSVYRLRNPEENNYHYLNYLLRTKLYVGQYSIRSKGIWKSRLQLSDYNFLDIPIIIPPKTTQIAIVNFLEKKLTKIERFIENKQKFIDGLQERKQAVINRAVTEGIDSQSPTKSCGIDWLSEVPKNWEVFPLKYLAAINTTALSEKTDPEKDILYVDISNVDSDGQLIKKETFKFKDAPSRARRVVSDGDTIISTVRTYLRAIGYIDNPEENLIVSTGFAVCTPYEKLVDKEFLQYAVRSNYFIEKVVSNSYGVSYPAITAERLGCHKIILPDTIGEQKNIVLYIKAETSVLDTAIEKAKQQITLIKEYRDSLITNAVTGQVEIKE